MILRIEDLTHPESKPLHVSLATALNAKHPDGVLLTIGRKNADLCLEDKAVSRLHCALRLVSMKSGVPKKQPNDKHGFDVKALFPKADEDENACSSSIDGLALVVDDLGRYVISRHL